jgi:hypothetical protein
LPRAAGAALLLALVLTLSTSLSSQKTPAEPLPIRLTDVAAEAGITLQNLSGGPRKDFLLEIAGNGAAWLDYDGDGWLDLLIANGSKIEHLDRGGDPMAALYRNNRNGTFTDVTESARLTRTGWGMGACAADFDNDGAPDFYLTAYGATVLYRNNGDGTFADVTARAGVADTRWSTGCAWGDYDRDGWLDLYVANYVALDVRKTPTRGVNSFCQYMGMDVLCGPRGLPGAPDALYRNNGDGTFTDVTEKAGIADPGFYGFQVMFSDLDADGWPDIYVANDSTPNFFFRNNRDGTFTDIALEAGVALSEEGRAQAGMGLDIADYDRDGRFDIFVTNFSHDTNTLYRNTPDGFHIATFAAGLGEASRAYLGWGAGFVDLDNDGWLDLLVANGHIYPEIDLFPLGSAYRQRLLLYRSTGAGRFQEIGAQMGEAIAAPRSGRGIAFADYDNDGDVDFLVVNMDARPSLFRNDGGNRQRRLSLRLRGTKSNRDAIGARVTVTAGGVSQTAEVRGGGSYLSTHDPRLHFGLGKAKKVDRIEVRWPSGLVQEFQGLAAEDWLLAEGGEPMPAGAKK